MLSFVVGNPCGASPETSGLPAHTGRLPPPCGVRRNGQLHPTGLDRELDHSADQRGARHRGPARRPRRAPRTAPRPASSGSRFARPTRRPSPRPCAAPTHRYRRRDSWRETSRTPGTVARSVPMTAARPALDAAVAVARCASDGRLVDGRHQAMAAQARRTSSRGRWPSDHIGASRTGVQNGGQHPSPPASGTATDAGQAMPRASAKGVRAGPPNGVVRCLAYIAARLSTGSSGCGRRPNARPEILEPVRLRLDGRADAP